MYSEFGIREITRVRDKSHSLCQLPRSGWSVGRAALGAIAAYAA